MHWKLISFVSNTIEPLFNTEQACMNPIRSGNWADEFLLKILLEIPRKIFWVFIVVDLRLQALQAFSILSHWVIICIQWVIRVAFKITKTRKHTRVVILHASFTDTDIYFRFCTKSNDMHVQKQVSCRLVLLEILACETSNGIHVTRIHSHAS